jgi:ribose 5-phosphate isomerase RpiB
MESGNNIENDIAWELVQSFLNADFKLEERFIRRLNKVSSLEKQNDE